MGDGQRCDVAIVGGGLAGGLIAHGLHLRRPELSLRLIEPGARLGGNHTWCYFRPDVAPADDDLIAPFVSHRWNGYDVRFPRHRRRFDTAYNAVRSEDFDRVLRARLPADAVIAARATTVRPDHVVLEDGGRIDAGGVIDARGGGDFSALDIGWQKFVGRELRLAAPHALERPVMMDATVDQTEGYRFVYLLPFSENELLIEDTYYSDSPDLDRDALTGRIADYAAAQGWTIATVLREEAGVLPVTIGGDFEHYWRAGGEGVAKAGVRAGLFHPTTGYSLPDAVRTAALVASLEDLSGKALHDALHVHARRTWADRGFYRLLDLMLFRAAAPNERYRVLERFYSLSPGLIERFYAGRSTLFDRFRTLAGKPPVPIMTALRVIAEGRR